MESILFMGKSLLTYPIQILVLLTAVALLFRVRLNSKWFWAVAVVGLLASFIRPMAVPQCASDFKVFYQAGSDVLAGVNPYHNESCLNPPTALPLYALLGMLTSEQACMVWTLSIVIGNATLIWLSQRTLATPGQQGWQLPPENIAALSAVVALSMASGTIIWVGQVSLLATVVVLLAVWAWREERPIVAGLLLAVATVKPQTMLPFLLLFHRRKDLPAWPAFVAGCLGLCLLGTPPAELISRTRECLANIQLLSTPGHMNNYPHWVCYDMIGFNRALHFLGVRDRTVVQVVSMALVLVIGAWVAWRVMGRKALTGPAAVCLVALYSTVFLYHRLYDMVILALPLVYVAGRAREAGPGRWWYCATAFAMLGVLFMRVETVKDLAMATPPDAVTGLLEAVILPYPLYLLLLALVTFTQAEYCRATVEATSTRANEAVMKCQSPTLTPELVGQS